MIIWKSIVSEKILSKTFWHCARFMAVFVESAINRLAISSSEIAESAIERG